MCLTVQSSHVKKPIDGMPCVKVLEGPFGYWKGFHTPYRDAVLQFGDGYFEPFLPAPLRRSEFRLQTEIEGGYLHAYTEEHRTTCWGVSSTLKLVTKLTSTDLPHQSRDFSAVAYGVVAKGAHLDIVCRRLYIPAFDLRIYTTKEIATLRKHYPDNFGRHTDGILATLGMSRR